VNLVLPPGATHGFSVAQMPGVDRAGHRRLPVTYDRSRGNWHRETAATTVRMRTTGG